MDLATFNACMSRLDALSQMADVPSHRRAELMRLASDLRLAYAGITPEDARQIAKLAATPNVETTMTGWTIMHAIADEKEARTLADATQKRPDPA